MRKTIYRLWEPEEFCKAGPSDLTELLPVPGQHPLFFKKSGYRTVSGMLFLKKNSVTSRARPVRPRPP